MVQNEKICKVFEGKRQIIKLHGCVNNPQEGFIFSSDEYSANIAREDYRLKEFSQDYFNNDMIFLGTEFNENDIMTILEKNKAAGFIENKCNYFFISPKIGYTLRSVINSKSNYHYINLDTKQFLQLCSDIKEREKSLNTLERILAQQGGFLKVSDYNKIPNPYESKLYYGNKVNFYDILTNWDIENSRSDYVIKNIMQDENRAYILAIYGSAFSGKTVVATRLLVNLYQRGYESYSYNCDGENELNQLNEYFSQKSDLKKVAVLIDDAAYLYGAIVAFIKNLPDHLDSIVFILVSNINKHESQKHELVGINCREWYVNDKLNDKTPKRIYSKLKDKNRLGDLKRYRDDRQAILKIAESKSITEFLYLHTRGQGFRSYFARKLNDFLSKASVDDIAVFKVMCVFAKLGINNVNKNLLLISGYTVNENQFEDLIVGFESSYGISLRCADVYDDFLFSLPSNERLEIVLNVLSAIANMFREECNNRWKNSFELLLKSKSLYKDLKIDYNDIVNLFARIEKYYNNVSYFWLQRGLLKQIIGEYEDARIFLQQALSIRPNSYQIRHAIAKNDLERSIKLLSVGNAQEAEALYNSGVECLEELIDSPRFSNNIGHSVHTYINTTIKYFKKKKQIIDGELILKMSEYLVESSKLSYDKWMRDCRRDLFAYCSNNIPNLKNIFDAKKFDKYQKFNYIRQI